MPYIMQKLELRNLLISNELVIAQILYYGASSLPY